VLVRSSLCVNIVQHSYENVEHLFLQISYGCCKFIVGGVYIPPDAPMEAYTAHCQAVEEIFLKYPNSEMFICGDFNVNGAD